MKFRIQKTKKFRKRVANEIKKSIKARNIIICKKWIHFLSDEYLMIVLFDSKTKINLINQTFVKQWKLFAFNVVLLLSKQKCSLMFFQKNIFWDLKLNKRFKVNRTTCFVFIYLFNLQFFLFNIHFLFFYYYFHWSCSLTICLSYHYIYLNIVFNFLEKSYKSENQNIDEKNEIDEVKINLTFRFSNLLLNYADYIINLHR